MTEKRQLTGVLISYEDDDLVATTQMLSINLRQYIHYISYNLPNEISLSRPIDFIVVSKKEALCDLQDFYQRSKAKAPRIIHLYNPHVHPPLEYATLYPDLEIRSVPQASFDRMDITLNFEAFINVIHELQAMPAPASV